MDFDLMQKSNLKNHFWRQSNLVSHNQWCHHPGSKHLIVWNHNQWHVNFEFDRCSPARLYLKPHSMDCYEIFRICKWNIKVNLIFSKFYDYANRFIVKDTPKVSENIWLSLYSNFRSLSSNKVEIATFLGNLIDLSVCYDFDWLKRASISNFWEDHALKLE